MERTTAHEQSVSRGRNKHKPTLEEWEAVKLKIQQLYINENKTLSEVSKILEKLFDFHASTKQYKNRFKRWGLWKNLSTTEAAGLIQIKALRDSIGKTSIFMRSGRKVNFDRVQKTIRRSKNRIPKNATCDESAKIGREGSAPLACNQPSKVECRSPSPERSAAKDDLDMVGSLDSNGSHLESTNLVDYKYLRPGTSNTHPSDSFLRLHFGDTGLSQPFDDHFEDPRVETIWDCYTRVHHKLALNHERLLKNAHSDRFLQHFRRQNSLLAVLEPVLTTNGRHIMRELFVANFVAAFSHHADLGKFTQSISQTSGQACVDTQASSRHAAVVESALQYLGLQYYTRQFIDANGNGSESESPSRSDESIPAPRTQSPDCNDYDVSTQAGELEAAAFAYRLGEKATAEARLQAFTFYDGAITTRGKVLIRLAWYCLSCVQRESQRDEEAEASLMQATRGSIYYSATEGVWEEASYLLT